MGSLIEALAIERNRLFVGREREFSLVKHWLLRRDPPTQILFISGMAGIGKSALMLQFLNMAQNEKIRSIWLDGRNCLETPAGFLESLQAGVSLRSGGAAPNPSIQGMVSAISQQKTLLCIDNYEYIQKIDGWLRSVFLPQFSASGLLVVMAARQNLAFEWQHDLAWRDRVKLIDLAPLSRHEAQDFYIKAGLAENKEMEKLISDTQGLPLAMALSVESFQLMKQETASSATWPLSLRISAELLREVVTSDLKETLDLLCILPQATPELLGRLLGTPLTAMNLHQLSQISFVRPTVGGLALHDVARSYLIEDFMNRDPGRYQALRTQIIEELAKQLKEARGQDKKRIASVLLTTCRDVFHIHSTPIISTNPDLLQMEPFRNTDLPHLHQIMTEEAEYSLLPETEHTLLDALAERFPESIRVFRSADGAPLVYTAGLLLYKETVAFLESYIPGVMDAVFPLESRHMQQLRLEQADTYYQLLTGVTLRESDYSFYELVGIIVMENIIHHSAGLQFVIVTAYEKTNELLRNLGFQTQPLAHVPKEHPLYGAAVHKQDWRGTEFGDHILDMLRPSSGSGEISTDDLELTEKDIKTSLPLVGNPVALGESELSSKLRCNGAELQEILQKILFSDPSFPLNGRKQEVLRLFSEMPFFTPELAAERLHISRATYYRVRNEAMKDLRDILIRRYAKPR